MQARLSATRRLSLSNGFEQERLLPNPLYCLSRALVLVLLYCCETRSQLLPFSCRQVLPGFSLGSPRGVQVKGRFSTEKHRSV